VIYKPHLSAARYSAYSLYAVASTVLYATLNSEEEEASVRDYWMLSSPLLKTKPVWPLHLVAKRPIEKTQLFPMSK
jgi:hypothetical protein